MLQQNVNQPDLLCVGNGELREGSRCVLCACPQGAFTLMETGRAVGHKTLWHICHQELDCVELGDATWAENGG